MSRELAGLDHGVNTAERKFLNRPEFQAVLDHVDFDEKSVATRLSGILGVLAASWGLSPAVGVALVPVAPGAASAGATPTGMLASLSPTAAKGLSADRTASLAPASAPATAGVQG